MRVRATLALASAGALALFGCGDPSTAAPKVQGKPRPDWSKLTKEQKIAIIQKQAIPEAAKQSAIQRIQAGID